MRNISYSIYPRYTAGSPAGVSEAVCRRVLAQEVEAIEFILLGYEGEEKQAEANSKGLEGIAIEQWEDRGFVYFRDLFTNKVTKRKSGALPFEFMVKDLQSIQDKERVRIKNKVYKGITDAEILVQIDKWWNRLGMERRVTETEAIQLQRLLFLIKQKLKKD